MIDPKVIRENYSEVKKNLTKRQQPEIIKKLDAWVEADKEWRKLKQEVDELRQERNKVTEEIKIAKSAKKDTTKLMEKAKKLPQELKEKGEQMKKLEEENKNVLLRIPNLLEDSVPYGKGDADNIEVKKWGETKKKDFEIKHHGQLIEEMRLVDFKNSTKISGEGFYALKGDLALLNMAIVQYAIENLTKKGFTLIIPPYMMNRQSYEGVTDLGDFENVMYKIDGEDHYMIATSEHPLLLC